MRKLKLLMVTLAMIVGGVNNTSADTSLLKSTDGWTKITSFPATLSDYYFVFVDKDNDLMLFYNTGSDGKQEKDKKTMFYTTSQDPIQNRGMLWDITSNAEGNGWYIKSSIESTYYLQTEGENKAWYCHTHDNGASNPYWYTWKFSYTVESLWTIENGVYSGNYIGPWNAASFTNDSEVAGNKTAPADIGHFYIYAIRKIDANVLSAITYLENRTDNAASITSLRTKYTNGTYTNSTTTEDVYNDYKALEISALSSASAGDYTSVLINPSFETGNMTGWKAIVANSETYPFYISDCGARAVASYPLTNSDGNYILNYYGWSWSCDPVNGIQQTLPDMPAGKYRIEAVLGGWKDWNIVLQVNDVYQSQTMDDANVGVNFSKEITLSETTDLTITAKTYSSVNTWRDCFIKADNFRIYNLDHYYDALNAAITAAESYTLGFEVGEYAPYNNTAAIAALNAAKAVNQANYDISWSELQTIVSNLTGATWTANVSEVNAFYKGDFSEYTEDTDTPLDYTPNGWTASVNFRMMLTDAENYPGLTDATSSHAVMSWAGGVTYGETTGYTMPLKANSIYKLSLKASGWNNEVRSNIKVSVLKDTEGMATYNLGTPSKDIKGNETNTAGLDSYEVLFATGSAGNYVFSISCDDAKNFTFTDLELKKAPNQYLEFADGSVPTYAPGTYPSVKITRTLTAGRWATAVYPFAVSGVDNIAVLKSFDAGTGSICFETASESVANKPFLMRSSSDKSEITLNNIAVSATTETPTVTKDEASLIGAYNSTEITKDKDNYVLFNNGIYDVGDAGATINPYRAYIQIAGGSGARSLVFLVDDEETTAIEGLNSERATTVGNIYNLNGQLVRKNADNLNGLRKGIYIVGGKRITVK